MRHATWVKALISPISARALGSLTRKSGPAMPFARSAFEVAAAQTAHDGAPRSCAAFAPPFALVASTVEGARVLMVNPVCARCVHGHLVFFHGACEVAHPKEDGKRSHRPEQGFAAARRAAQASHQQPARGCSHGRRLLGDARRRAHRYCLSHTAIWL